MNCPKCSGTGEINILYHERKWFTLFGWAFGPTTSKYLPEPCFNPGCHKGQIDWEAYSAAVRPRAQPKHYA